MAILWCGQIDRMSAEIVHMGFDSIKWEAGYTALHYAAEHIDDARALGVESPVQVPLRIVELLCSLAVDVSAKDDKARTVKDVLQTFWGDPSTFSLQNGDNVKSINKFRKQAGMLILSYAVPIVSIVVSSEPSTASTTSTIKEEGDEEMFRAARQCRGFLHKYPTSGRHFWRIRGNFRNWKSAGYFAVLRRHGSWELGYWVDDASVGEAGVQICYREDGNDKKLLAVARDLLH
ncbi:hypothetical protein AK812_SmicGene1228 [Symbiodinium microadriaticum]|uniref:Uncharacterized protein n=1 Tax=Symbiodinium microadriaticum TaxID=2951 RepID=A0A1Q9F4N0_SYMMI|nr:hypothetical protein AK812_SmicGene1228 [Symbiodinium microadriaticum]